jgi:hypothetical protein
LLAELNLVLFVMEEAAIAVSWNQNPMYSMLVLSFVGLGKVILAVDLTMMMVMVYFHQD